MKLRNKLSLAILATLIIFLSITFLVSRSILVNSFIRFEHRITLDEIHRVHGTLTELSDSLNALTESYASWEKIYNAELEKIFTYFTRSSRELHHFLQCGPHREIYFR